MLSVQPKQIRRIAIVGAGLSGTSFLSGFVDFLRRDRINNIEIHIFEKSDEFGPGIYATSFPETCLLNHENDSMGWVAPGEQEAGVNHYSKYLQTQAEQLFKEHPCLDISILKDPKGYTPRFVYGKYLKAGFAAIEVLAKSADIPLFKHQACVEKIQVFGEQAQISWQTNGEIHTLDQFEKVILTTGHCWEKPLLENSSKSNQFFQVYPVHPLTNKAVIAGKRVGVIGTGLSGVDGVFTAIKGGAEQVILTSSSGRMRSVRGPVFKYHRKYFTRNAVDNIVNEQGQISLKQVMALLLQEYTMALETYLAYQKEPINFKNDPWACYVGQNFYVPDEPRELNDLLFPENPLERLRKDVEEAESCPRNKGLLWRSLVKSMYDIEDSLEFGDYVYQQLSDEDKVKFMKEVYRLSLNFTAAMPISSAKRLLALEKEGKLVIIKGLEKITDDPDSGLLKMEIKNSKPVYVDIGVDATGYAKDMSLHPIYKDLIICGQAMKHPTGGISIEPTTHALITNYGVSSVLFAIGPATIGSAYFLKPDSIGDSTTALSLAKQIYATVTESDLIEINGTKTRVKSHQF
ncbi:MAG: FAD/NAD(P)-binding protein [Crocosphaera sp.]